MTFLGGSPLVPPAVRDDFDGGPEFIPCCMGSAMRGPAACTCWEPVYDLEQAPLDLATEPCERATCCGDCAYRNGSPEREDEYGAEHLAEVVGHPGKEFWCHQGVRRVIAFRHPDGRELPAGEGDYRPPVGANASGVECVWLADGSAGERCAGWAAHRKTVAA